MHLLNYFNRPSFIACVPSPHTHYIYQWPAHFRQSRTRAGVLHKIHRETRFLTARQKPLNFTAWKMLTVNIGPLGECLGLSDWWLILNMVNCLTYHTMTYFNTTKAVCLIVCEMLHIEWLFGANTHSDLTNMSQLVYFQDYTFICVFLIPRIHVQSVM